MSLRRLVVSSLTVLSLAAPAAALDRWPLGDDPATTETMRVLLRAPEGTELEPVGVDGAVARLDVGLTASDGMHLAATWYGVPGVADPPVAILLHEQNGDRRDLAALAAHLVRHDVAVLALDLRGHGESITQQGVTGEVRANQFTGDVNSPRWAEMARDVEAAVVWVRGHRVTANPRVVVVGSVMGGGAAAQAEARLVGHVQGLVLVSPVLTMGGFRLLNTLPAAQTPYVILASKGDNRALNTIAQLKDQSTAMESRVFPGGRRGSELLADADVRAAIVAFATEGLLPPPVMIPEPTPTPTPTPTPEPTDAPETGRSEESPAPSGEPTPTPAAEPSPSAS